MYYWGGVFPENKTRVAAWVLILIGLLYIGLLFAIAWYGDRRALHRKRVGPRPVIYALSLAVYCTSWTFYGNVGSAATVGWSFVPIYLGPIIALIVFAPVLRKILIISKQQNTTSIADFIAARYGKSQGLAALVSVIALLVVLPYIALQLKALTMSFTTLAYGAHVSHAEPNSLFTDTAMYVAIAMALFAILFGTRHVNPRESHQGIILAIAFESVVKLFAFLAVGIFVVWGLFDGIDSIYAAALDIPHLKATYSDSPISSRFITTSLLSVAAIFCLPRQFHVGVVENTDTSDLFTARWLFPLYLVISSLFVLPIAIAGLTLFPDGAVTPDRFVLALPVLGDSALITMLAFIGGLSAATSMVIMASVALSTMLCNDILVPILMRLPRLRLLRRNDLSAWLLRIRRALILLILVLGYLCYRLFGITEALASIGLISFAGAILFLPALLGGLYIRGITRRGVMAGLSAGVLMWVYTLVLPHVSAFGWLDSNWLNTGPAGLSWLRPQALFGFSFRDTFTHGVFWSLLTDIVVMAAVSSNTQQNLVERAQASAFVDLGIIPNPAHYNWQPSAVRVGELEVVLQRFLGAQVSRQALDDYAMLNGTELMDYQIADSPLLQFAERRLAGVVGSASARVMLASGLRHKDLQLGDMAQLLDQTADAVQFNRSILQAALENVDHGISVIDHELRLVAWNNRYLDLFEYPPGLVRPGRPIADLIRFNAARGECGPGTIEEQVRKRVEYMRQGRSHTFERHRQNGTVLQMHGSPMPGGGFVTTFNDITEFKRTESALKQVNEELEARVTERTAALSRANKELREENSQRAIAQQQALRASRDAEKANLSKTRFLAAASHDLLQPLNAARLFAASAPEHGVEGMRRSLGNIQSSLEAAQSLLNPLLDISKIDAGSWDARLEPFPINQILSPLAAEFRILAQDRGLGFDYVASSCWVCSDPALLRRIIQNFLSNAIRYTSVGRVALGCRRRDDTLEIQIWDTGPGIAPDQIGHIFDEFQRGSNTEPGDRGLGLGLSLADRMARLLDHTITVNSVVDRGTVFSIDVGQTDNRPKPRRTPSPRPDTNAALESLRVLCIDDNAASLTALNELLQRWDMRVSMRHCMAQTPDETANDSEFDAAIVDYNLGDAHPSGLEVIEHLIKNHKLACVLITADRDPIVRKRARALGVAILYKPIAPAKLRAVLSHIQTRRSAVSDSDR